MKRPGRTRLPWLALILHLAALVFGLIGLLIMLPHPNLWASDPNAVRVFDWSMDHAGATHIVLGALAMASFGWLSLGWGKTVAFFLVSYFVSLGFELFGTSTGWPFGNYEYTGFLGYKVLGRVPWTIPLSWFYMGLASYLIGTWLAGQLQLGRRSVWSVVLGVWLLTAWDLVLDPAMAHESLRVKFWVWREQGPYFGMPIENFVGWAITALVFMGFSRYLWKEEARLDLRALRLPAAVYVANMVFAITISASVGLWAPVAIALAIAGLPVALTRVHRREAVSRAQLSLGDD